MLWRGREDYIPPFLNKSQKANMELSEGVWLGGKIILEE